VVPVPGPFKVKRENVHSLKIENVEPVMVIFNFVTSDPKPFIFNANSLFNSIISSTM
jgi:hypothetical protein